MLKFSQPYKPRYLAPVIENADTEDNKILLSEKFFVTYANPKYFNIVYYLIKGIDLYSNIPVIIYIVNPPGKKIVLPDKFNIFKNIVVRYVSSTDHIWATKFTILTDSIEFINNKDAKLIYLDADTIVNHSINELFNYSNKVENIPYLSVHPDYIEAVNSLHSVLGKGKKIIFNKQWGHSNVIWYNKNCIDIFKQGYSLIIRHRGLGDEQVINYLQNKNNLLENIPYMTPNFMTYKKYISKYNFMDDIGKKKSGEYFEEIFIHLFHGCKDPDVCDNIFNQLKEFNTTNIDYQTHYKIV
jgi:hypothetical protein|tara:strand:- start:6707 stop:7600 length:894 start_codon:yes stop_codon:yes gene_type:complete